MLKIFIASTDIADTPVETRLSPYRTEKIERVKSTLAKKERKAAGVLLSYALKRCYGIDESEMEYAVGENGKPYFVNRRDICFNLSHTKELCAVAISDKAVGIDAEYVEKLTDARLSAFTQGRFFSSAEISAYSLDVEAEAVASKNFYRLWTAKESIVKCTGEGVANGFKSISVPFFTGRCECNGMFITSIETENHVLSVCSSESELPEIKFVQSLTL